MSNRYIRNHSQKKLRRWPLLLLLVIVAVAVGVHFRPQSVHATQARNIAHAASAKTTASPTQTASTIQKAAPTPQPCDGNTLAQNIIVSISARHLWACEAGKQVFDSAVVTGMEQISADLTPTGTYHIASKQQGLYLDGSDSTGSWHDYVYYWMPFLENQYGTYGFHDATWRQPSAFGNIDPNSSDGSHGCVELPLATAKWLYGWAQVGTTVTIKS